MKIIQIPFCFYPDPVGGTEVYVEALSKNLQSKGADILIACAGPRDKDYSYDGLKVKRFAVSDRLRLNQLYSKRDPLAIKGLSKILEEEKPDLIHIHSFTSACSTQSVIEAKQKGIKVIFTYHTPAASCQRSTLMYRGKSVCDGRLLLRKCARCTLQGLGLSRLYADMVGSFPPIVGKTLGRMRLEGGLWTGLRMSELIVYHLNAFTSFISEVDHIVAVCKWAKQVLMQNGVPKEKITVIRQGLSQQTPAYSQTAEGRRNTLRLAFFGRLHPTKGLDIVVRALRKIPHTSIKLDVYGIVQDNNAYYRGLLKIAAVDNRISFKESVLAEDVIEILKTYDYLIVPSQWMETGPMVILEAFAAGVPVIASNLGGIAEIVKDGIDGILVKWDEITAWSETLSHCFYNKELRNRLQRGIKSPETIDSIGDQMRRLYTQFA